MTHAEFLSLSIGDSIIHVSGRERELSVIGFTPGALIALRTVVITEPSEWTLLSKRVMQPRPKSPDPTTFENWYRQNLLTLRATHDLSGDWSLDFSNAVRNPQSILPEVCGKGSSPQEAKLDLAGRLRNQQLRRLADKVVIICPDSWTDITGI